MEQIIIGNTTLNLDAVKGMSKTEFANVFKDAGFNVNEVYDELQKKLSVNSETVNELNKKTVGKIEKKIIDRD